MIFTISNRVFQSNQDSVKEIKTESDIFEIVKTSPKIIKDIPKEFQSERVCLAAIKHNPEYIKYCRNNYLSVIKESLNHNPEYIKYLNHDTLSEDQLNFVNHIKLKLS